MKFTILSGYHDRFHLFLVHKVRVDNLEGLKVARLDYLKWFSRIVVNFLRSAHMLLCGFWFLFQQNDKKVIVC